MTIPGNRRIRFAIYGVVAAVLLLIGALDRPYLASAKILPQDPSESGPTPLLSSAVRPPTEFYLSVARSREVQVRTANNLKLVNKSGLPDADRVENLVRVDAIPGGLLLVEAKGDDPAFVRRLLTAYLVEIDKRLGDLGRERTELQKTIAKTKLAEALARLAQAQNALKIFQKEHGFSAPEHYFGSAVASQIRAEAEVHATQIDLENQIQLAQSQLAASKRNEDSKSSIRLQANNLSSLQRKNEKLEMKGNVAGALHSGFDNRGDNEKKYFYLFSNEKNAEIVYDVYVRYLQQSLFWEINTQKNAQIIDSPFVSGHKNYNKRVVAGFILLAFLIFLIEVYIPNTINGRRY